MSRLQSVNLTDFTGGLNSRRSQFTLDPTESPALLNIDIDPRSGFYTRKGWQRWNATDIVDVTGDTFAAGTSSISGDGATVTVALPGHGLTTGDEVVVSGGTVYDGTWTITVTGADEFTFADTETATVTNAVITKEPFDWEPRLAKKHPKSDGSYDVYIAALADSGSSTGSVYVSNQSASFVDLALTADADFHLADFAAWGDDMYIACGNGNQSQRRSGGTTTAITDSNTNYNDDYTTPLRTNFPKADFIETHAGYMFAASIEDEGGPSHFPNRVRWSHPDEPRDWAELDYLDIERGGGRITGLLSFRDHLLIFKTDSVWALYGYDLDTWQLVQVSSTAGTPGPASFTKSESAVYFFSASNRNDIYGYDGGAPVAISEKIRTVLDELTNVEAVTVGWLGRKLRASIPVQFVRNGVTFNSTVFVFDPEIGNGVWTRHASGTCGCVGPFVDRSDVGAQYPLAVLRGNSGAAAVVQFDFRDDALDYILETYDVYLVDELGRRVVDANGNFIVVAPEVDGTPFTAFYRTGWHDAGQPERRKSWLRPRYVVRAPAETVEIRADAYRDYDESTIHRSAVQAFSPRGGAYWTAAGAASVDPPGFDWGDGTLWGAAEEGGRLERVPGNLGLSAAVQLEISSSETTPGKAWGIDAIILKFNARRFTT